MAAFLGQIGALFVTILKLKRWRFLWLIVFGVSVMSNHFLYKAVSSWLSNFGMQSYFSVDGDAFAKNGAIVGQLSMHQNRFDVLLGLINEQRTQLSKKYTIQNCSQDQSENDCSMKFLNMVIQQSDNSFSHYVEYSDVLGGKPRIVCNMAFGSEAYCPFIASLVATAGYGVAKAPYRFKKVSTFRYVPLVAKPLWPKLVKIRGADTVCVQDTEFLTVMPRSVMVQSFLLLCSIFIYLLASTVPCISDLKRQGFLQMLFRRGLSVPAFWLALWAVTLVELLLVSAGLAASHYLQCPNFYDITRLAKVALVFATQAGSIASLVFLLTVAIGTQFVIGVATLLLASASSIVLAASLILLHWLQGLAWTRIFLLALPTGLLGEQLQAVLASQLRPDAEASFHTWALVVSACVLVAAALLTLYLDCALASGSGMYAGAPHFPCLLACGRRTQRVPSDAVPPEPPLVTVEPALGAKPAAQIRGVSKTVGSCVCCCGGANALSNVTATLYENQLSAFVGHSGSGKSTLLSILSGKTTASAGYVVMSGYNLSDARTRRNLMLSTGVCYQHNALCLGITVADSIGLVRRACGVKQRKHDAEARHILEQLGLKEKLGERVSYLSSGQRRKLCIALALLGNPKVIVLDEPTSNLDPASRMQMWKLLQEYRVGRCIVIGTSLMEEADALADRSVFLSSGAVVCAGSPLFFRRAFDCGFVFQTLMKTERHASWVLRAVNRQFPTVRARSICRNELELEVTATHDQLLPGVAIALEKMPELIDAIGLSQRSLEQIFRQLTAMSPEDVNRLFQTGEIGYSADEAVGDFAVPRRPRQSIQQLSPTGNRTEKKARKSPALLRRLALMMKISVARIVRKGSNIFSRIVLPVSLILLLIAALVLDKILKSSSLDIWSVLMDSSKRNFTEGICIDDTDIAGYHHRPEPRLCREMFSPLDNSSTKFIFKSKVTNTPLQNHLMNDVVRDYNFQTQCSQGKIQCPLFYASDWCEDHVTNDKRIISMGMYSLNEVFKLEKATTTLLWTYEKALTRFNFHLYKNVTLDTSVTGVKDFRSTFVPVFGVFLQIVILCIIPATYLDDLIEDRASGMRQHLTSLGMSCFPYWISIFMVHWVQYALVYILSTIIVIAMLPKHFLNMCFFLSIILPTLFLGLTSNQLSAYFVSTIFSKQNAALAIVYAIFSTILGLSPILAQVDNMTGLVIICIFPQVASVAMTFYGSKLIIYALAFTKVEKLSSLTSPLSIPMMSLHMKLAFVAMIAHILLLCLVILLMEKRRSIARCCCGCCHRKARIAAQPLDSDDDLEVRQETGRLDSCPRDSRHLLEVRHLRLLDRSGSAVVRDVTFGVRPGEIFGLVGPNGSGKSAVMSAIAGDTRPHAGDTEVLVVGEDNLWLPCHEAASWGTIGYCKTSNPLLSHLTVEEHLNFYAAVLGLASDDSSSAIEDLLKKFRLEEVKGNMTCHISSSCKRRLSMAITVLGDPTVVVIDDPSVDSDADERRIIWNALISVASNRRAVVVTMHSMEEVEGLCTRVGVMNQGLLVAIGDVNRILDRYGLYYTLSVKLEEDAKQTNLDKRVRVDALLKAIGSKYRDAQTVEHMAASALVCVPAASIGRLSDALKWLLDHKQALGIALFSLRRVHLDEVFQLIVRGHDERLQRSGRATDSMVEAIPVDHMGDAAADGNLRTGVNA